MYALTSYYKRSHRTGVSREKPQGVGFFCYLISDSKFKKSTFWSTYGLESKFSNIHLANTLIVFGDFWEYRIVKVCLMQYYKPHLMIIPFKLDEIQRSKRYALFV